MGTNSTVLPFTLRGRCWVAPPKFRSLDFAQRGDYAAAEREFTRAASAGTEPNARAFLALTLAATSRCKQAEPELEKTLVTASGDVMKSASLVLAQCHTKHIDVHFKYRRILYRNFGEGKFEDVSERSGPGIATPHSSRGLAMGDIDNDEVIEAVVNNQGEPPSLLKQSAKPPGHWVRIELEGTRSNRSAIGARVLPTAGGITQVDEVRSGGSYLSQSELSLHFGLGGAHRVDRVKIRWPNGLVEEKTGLEVDRPHKFKEPAR